MSDFPKCVHPFFMMDVQARPILMRAVEGESYDQMVDPRLENNYNPDEMLRMVACSAACINRSARRRPKMSQVCMFINFILG